MGRRERQRLLMRERLLSAALDLFAANGFAETTIDQIAERADVARQTVLNHFPHKTDFARAWGQGRRDRLAAIGEGRLAIICPDARHAALTALYPLESDLLDSPVAVLTVVQSKGLEFDTVLVVAPDEILAQSPKGGHDLYVAITRATRRLTVLHERELPEMLNRLSI